MKVGRTAKATKSKAAATRRLIFPQRIFYGYKVESLILAGYTTIYVRDNQGKLNSFKHSPPAPPKKN